MRTPKKLAIIMALSVAVALLASGCVSNPTPTPTRLPTVTPMVTVSPVVTPMVTPETSPMTTPMTTVTPNGTQTSLISAEEAAKIAAEVDKISEVEKSTVLVSGDNALVGVQFAAQYQGELTDRVKEMVIEKVKGADSNIKNIAVTADPDIVSRITAMYDGLKSGNTAALSTEFTEIYNRVQPTVS